MNAASKDRRWSLGAPSLAKPLTTFRPERPWTCPPRSATAAAAGAPCSLAALIPV
jgi:hypothetical protein